MDNKMKLTIQLFASSIDDNTKDHKTGVDFNISDLSSAYIYLNSMNSSIESTIGELSSINVLPGISDDGGYTDALKCLNGGNNLVSVSSSVSLALNRVKNVMKAVAMAEGASEEDFNNYLNQLNNYDDETYGIDLDNFSNPYEYWPETKSGSFNTHLLLNNSITILSTLKYTGEYITFENKNGLDVRVPLAVIKCKDGKIYYEPMTEEEKARYIPKVTTYYNDIMTKHDTFTDQFKKELSQRVESLILLYIDPAQRKDVESAAGAGAYCAQKNGFSTHSNIVMFTENFMDINDRNSDHNNQERYDYMVGAYIHENGHAYANNSSLPFCDRDDTAEWKNIYSTVSSMPGIENVLRSYSVSNRHELFADCSDYYYTQPDRLKMIDINYKGYKTMYDYMNHIMQGN